MALITKDDLKFELEITDPDNDERVCLVICNHTFYHAIINGHKGRHDVRSILNR